MRTEESFEVWLRYRINEIIGSDPLVQTHLNMWQQDGIGATLAIDTGDGVPGSEDDMTCDRCGEVAEGLGLASIGFRIKGNGSLDYVNLPTQERIPLMVTLGICPRCWDETDIEKWSNLRE